MEHLIILLAQSIMVAFLLLVLGCVIYWIILAALYYYREITVGLTKIGRVGYRK